MGHQALQPEKIHIFRSSLQSGDNIALLSLAAQVERAFSSKTPEQQSKSNKDLQLQNLIFAIMRNSYLRPLNFNYVDTFEKKYQIQEIPVKFMDQPDDYQKREKRQAEPSQAASSDIYDQASAYQPLPVIPQQPEDIVDIVEPANEPSGQVVEPVKIKVYEDPVIEPIHKSKEPASKSVFACCQEFPEESELCERCLKSLCPSCLSLPSRLRGCTRCLQRLCAECKQHLRIAFSEVKIRNYPITLKSLSELHFQGCTCPQCKQKP